ncbi:MAG: helix-turn-helix domain-containing protein [Simkania sp.]|nr:helix-turn-helix domain-containing protein [Simkania sp.]
MPEGYHHLTRDRRCQLHTLKNSGESTSNIAIQLGVHRSAIYRELKHNRGLQGYAYLEAQKKASERKL